jgi:hypothetical protein
MTEHDKQIIANVVRTLIEAVEESAYTPLGGIPSSHLYLIVQEKLGASADTYEKLVQVMLATGRVKRSHGHLLTPA